MNFQTARANPGKFTKMIGTATKLDIKSGDYGPYGLGSITDTYGESQNVLFASSEKSPLVGDSCLHQPASWAVRYDANTQKYKVYFEGFQIEHSTTFPAQISPPQIAHPVSQLPPQGPQNARQATNARQVSPDSLFIGKQAVWKGYCEAVKNSEGAFDVNIAIDQCWQVWNKFMIPEAQPLELANNPNDFQQFADEHPVEQDGNPY
jgi:hypothetical protein